MNSCWVDQNNAWNWLREDHRINSCVSCNSTRAHMLPIKFAGEGSVVGQLAFQSAGINSKLGFPLRY